jgi:hypothetical protein
LDSPSEEGGRDEFREFCDSRRSKSTTCSFNAATSTPNPSITAACSTTNAAAN